MFSKFLFQSMLLFGSFILLINSKGYSLEKVNEPIVPIPFTKAELLDRKVRDTYEGDYLNMVAFPLGGLGTGCISLSGTGKLVDWEIFNKPNKGYQPRFSFLSVWAKADGEQPVFKILEGQLREDLQGPKYLTPEMWYLGNGSGPQQTQAAGLPRMRQCRFEGRFPFAKVHLSDKHLPLSATIEGWSPFIPGNDKDSSIPVAILNVTLKNITSKVVNVSLGINVQNQAGNRNEVIREPNFYSLYMHDENPDSASMFIATPTPATTWQTNWIKDNIFMTLDHFVRTFAQKGLFDEMGEPIMSNAASERHFGEPTEDGNKKGDATTNEKVGSLGVQMVLQPNEQKTIPLIIGWYFPIFDTGEPGELGKDIKSWKNYYATQWKSGLDVARYVVQNLKPLEKKTRLFQKSFFSSTLPGVVLEAISSQLSVLRSPTIIRYPDGTLYGWEGCAVNKRLGYGTCNHVYNYQQVIPFLFPKVQRSILENFYVNGFREADGAVQFRLPLGPGARAEDWEARWPASDGGKTKYFTAADGQLGMVCQVYRDWQLSGDDNWLKTLWPKVKKSLDHAWVEWDVNRDGLLEGVHHNTLDLNFTTPDPFCGSIYQAALLAGERMALYLGDKRSAKQYRKVYLSGKKLTDELLFNGEYYHQMLPAPKEYQLENGSISEQLHGQLYAKMLGFEDVFSPENIHKALGSLFKYNFQSDFYDFINVYRAYSIGKDKGLVIASWPKGGRPEKPLLYADETMSGFEYQVAGNLLYEGYILEGLTVVKAIRDRYDGKRRNPYNEFEWGNHYARSMANYSSLLALSGFRYSGVEKAIYLKPQVYSDDFCVFFSVDGGWGAISQKKSDHKYIVSVKVEQGQISLSELILKPELEVKHAIAGIADRKLKAKIRASDGLIHVQLDSAINIATGQSLVIELN